MILIFSLSSNKSMLNNIQTQYSFPIIDTNCGRTQNKYNLRHIRHYNL